MGKVVGEAVVVDLGTRGLLFSTFESEWSLSRGGGGYNADLAAFPQEKFRGKYSADASANSKYAAYLDDLNRLKPKAELPLKYLPVLVRFRNPNDPTSVELVDPSNLAASFGPGVALKGAFVEITNDPVTKGIEARLPWLKSSNEDPTLFPPLQYLGPHTKTSPVRNLSYDDFRRLP
jgi:hypothetical protein